MQVSLSWIILFQVCYINEFFSLLPTAHIYVRIFSKLENV